MSSFRKAPFGRTLVCALALGVATPALAAAETRAPAITELSVTGPAGPAGRTRPEADPSRIQAVARSGGVCRAGFDIPTSQLVLDGSGTFARAADVRMKKPCKGAVVVRFVTVATLPDAGDMLFVQLLAKCVNPAAFANACTKGEALFGVPGGYGYPLATGPLPGAPVRSTQWIYSGLKPGVWHFTVHAASSAEADVSLRERSLTVDAYTGG